MKKQSLEKSKWITIVLLSIIGPILPCMAGPGMSIGPRYLEETQRSGVPHAAPLRAQAINADSTTHGIPGESNQLSRTPALPIASDTERNREQPQVCRFNVLKTIKTLDVIADVFTITSACCWGFDMAVSSADVSAGTIYSSALCGSSFFTCSCTNGQAPGIAYFLYPSDQAAIHAGFGFAVTSLVLRAASRIVGFCRGG